MELEAELRKINGMIEVNTDVFLREPVVDEYATPIENGIYDNYHAITRYEAATTAKTC